MSLVLASEFFTTEPPGEPFSGCILSRKMAGLLIIWASLVLLSTSRPPHPHPMWSTKGPHLCCCSNKKVDLLLGGLSCLYRLENRRTATDRG